MRKLKTWEIVLLVIFYPVGICVLIYRLWKKGKLKQEAEEAQRTAAEERERRAAADRERREREEAEKQARVQAAVEADRELRRLYDDYTFKVVGVTFKNANGRTRQGILRKLKFGDEPFNKDDVNITVEKGEYEGEPAFSVYAEGLQVGNIGRDDIPFILSRWERFIGVIEFDVSGGGRDEGGYSRNYGMTVRLRFKKDAPLS